jgi:uncharacterized membrane protein YkvA (DUF1232 family)
MTTLDLIKVMDESKLSAEDLGTLIGISGMTIRRWIERASSEPLPDIYQTAMRNAVFKLVIEGRLNSDTELVKNVFAESNSLPQEAAVKALGFGDMDGAFENHQDKIMKGLSRIGAMESRRTLVDNGIEKLPLYKKLGRDWNERLTLLSEVVTSSNLSLLDKLPAYGALFYLFMTFDLIPDTIPVFGLVDDFSILGIAAAYYIRRAKNLDNQ